MTRTAPIVAAAFIIAGALAVSGCGQKGPLYLRDNPPPGVKPPRPAPYEPVPYPEGVREGPDAPDR
ncbi:MAG: lipoprotein [Burkholderiales bacterium]|nr:lipoprotein [Burkholderiales bacterium]